MPTPGCIHFALFLALWLAGVICWVVALVYHFRARRYFRPRSFFARWFSPIARWRTSNFAPEAASFVVRERLAVVASVFIAVVAVATGHFGASLGTTSCTL